MMTLGMPARVRSHGAAMLALVVCIVACTLAGTQTPAFAAATQWSVTSVSRPTNFASGDQGGIDSYVVAITNSGSAPSDGSPIVVTEELPAGLQAATSPASGEDQLGVTNGAKNVKLSCLLDTCTYAGVVVPGDTLLVRFPLNVPSEAPESVVNHVRVAGGGAPTAIVPTETTISHVQAGFGISPGGSSTALSSVQAGAHPDLTTAITFNTVRNGGLAGNPKDTTDTLPPGFAGDLVDTPACSAVQFLQGQCPIGTQVGITTLNLAQTGQDKGTQLEPVYNLDPGPGDAAKIGFSVGELHFEADVVVRPGDYGIQTTFHNADEGVVELEKVTLTIWGVPADPSHDPLRFKASASNTGTIGTFGAPSEAAPAPFLTSPTGCATTQLRATFSANSWEHPDQFAGASMPFGPTVGCDRLGMEPSLTAEATTAKASSPTGLDLVMNIPQTYDNPGGLATSTLNRAVVTLPEGMTVNPSAGAGLAACTIAEFQAEGVQPESGEGCPSESKLGTVKITTPSLKEEASGTVFLAAPAPFGEPGKNPFNSLLALYIVARIPNRGILVRAAGEVHADESTGRLVTTFDTSDPAVPHGGLPPLPFSQFTFRFNQGATSPLVTPAACGAYAVTAALNPLAIPTQILQPAILPFSISSGFDGGPCPAGGVPPFAPQVSGGTLNNAAGSYSPLEIRVTRNDGEQEITRFSAQLPAGLTANLTGVPFCSDAAIAVAKVKSAAQEEAEPSCGAASRIGSTEVGAGVGSVLSYAPGIVYMAGPYNGAPFSIAAITTAKVGPFDLGTVVVRVALKIDPQTAAVTVDAAASDPIPHIIKGIVVHVRDIRVHVDRPGFSLNPTSCERMRFGVTVSGSGADIGNPADDIPIAIQEPFQAADCQALGFRPIFTASTSGKTSKRVGASLSVSLTYPKAPQGSQANIKFVKVDLPLQLPSRLTTLQKACPDSTFTVNPAACPLAAIVGHATAQTPILPVPLSGPAYFVSHGGAKFPELVVVLQGYGVTIQLHGETFISKAGITSSTFRNVPDQPVSSFQLTLPQGTGSALAAFGNLCAPVRTVIVKKTVARTKNGKVKRVTRSVRRSIPSALTMPTTFTAQNGATIRQNTPIAVTGCAKHGKALKRASAHRRGAGKTKTN